MRRMRTYQIIFLILFVGFAILSATFSLIPSFKDVSLTLLMVNFFIALVIAVYGSLAIREEEEERG
jgi:hypothetical protein